ncbi:MAG: hypothetical protein QM572_19055 [Nocardioides sp.]|uniref:hypothetical protein n=1 Tax=Nocardioides sp. TaxID=35761 RepID=UPI0039E2F0B0
MVTGRGARISALLLILAAAAAAVLAWAVPSSRPVEARLVIVGPAVVSTSLVEQADPAVFDAWAGTSASAALDAVRRGRADAAVVIDLTADTDTLYLSDASGSTGRRALTAAVGEVSGSLGRGVDVERVPIPHDRRTPYVVVLAALVLGFLAAIVATWLRGTFEPTFRAGTGRFVVFCGVGAVAGLACAGLGWTAVPLVTALVVAAALTTTALEALLDLGGIAASGILFLLVAGPLGRFTPTLLVPQPWHAVTPWLPHGAGLALADDIVLFGGAGAARDWAVVAVWVALSVLTLSVARNRRRSG